jgi:hypothetical protein
VRTAFATAYLARERRNGSRRSLAFSGREPAGLELRNPSRSSV